MAVIIDAADYFVHLKTAILQARHSIFLVGWDFDVRIELDRTGRTSNSIPNRVGQLLDHAIRLNPSLRVYVLRWDLAFLKVPLRGTTPFFCLIGWVVTAFISILTSGIRQAAAITRKLLSSTTRLHFVAASM